MVRIQVQLEDAQHDAIRRLAQGRRISKAEAIRRVVAVGLRVGLDGGLGPSGAKRLLRLAGIAASGLPDLGRRHDAALGDDFKR